MEQPVKKKKYSEEVYRAIEEIFVIRCSECGGPVKKRKNQSWLDFVQRRFCSTGCFKRYQKKVIDGHISIYKDRYWKMVFKKNSEIDLLKNENQALKDKNDDLNRKFSQ